MPNFDDFNDNTEENTIIELNTMDEETSILDTSEISSRVIDDEIKITSKKKKEKKPKKNRRTWYDLTKKEKILIITIPSVILVLIITGLLLYFLVFKKEDKLPKEPTPNIVLEKDNYIYKNGVLEFLDSNDKVIGTYECQDKDAEKCYIAVLSNEDVFDAPIYLDSENKVMERSSKIYDDKYVFVYDHDVINLYDMKEEETKGEYELIKTSDLVADLVAFKDTDNKYGVLKFGSKEVETLVKPEYEYLGIYNSDKAFVVKDSGFTYLIDASGKALTTKLKGEIKSFNEKYVSINNNGYLLYNYSGLTALDDTFDFIEFKDGYIFTIMDSRMYAYDSTLFKMNEVGIKIKGTDYVPTYTFDDKNKLEDTKKAYTISITTGSINIELADKSTKKINIYETLVSKKTPYISYLDGVLYVYGDKAKDELLGSYSCTNKNDIKNASSEFTNCYVAKNASILSKDEAVGFIPIIDKQYIFINDTKEGANKPNIILYDLKGKTSLAKYQKVDITAHADDISFVDAVEDIIIAQNTEGDYGVIEIKGEGPKGLVKFKGTKNLSYFKAKYLLVQRDNYYLYDLSDLREDNIIAESKFAIIDYRDGNMIVKDEKYALYSKDGKVLKTDFDHAYLEDAYAVGIVNNSLNLYELEEGNAILESDVKLLTNDDKYENFRIKADSSYIIEVLKEDGSYVSYEFDLGGKKVEKTGGEKVEKK